MKATLTTLLAVVFTGQLFAQVEKTILVEHFTNSRCGVCDSKNPGLYQNLSNHPDILHIAFHPSSPYASCIFSQHNKIENDARTNYYGVYGATPRIVIQGEVQPPGTNFTSPSIFEPFVDEMTPFVLKVKEYRYQPDNVVVEVMIKSDAIPGREQARLFVGFAEDTVFYMAPNGEDLHYDVFRKALTDVEGDVVMLPASGDSVVLMFNVSIDPVWNIDRMYAMAILQDPSSKEVLQAGNTSVVEYMAPSFIGSFTRQDEGLKVYPNPADSRITVTNAKKDIFLYSSEGRLISIFEKTEGSKLSVDISCVQKGIYFLRSGERSAKISVVR
jgi:hypothetical protein